ncbi:hypothetical protein D9M71_658610 [compost metagenome]
MAAEHAARTQSADDLAPALLEGLRRAEKQAGTRTDQVGLRVIEVFETTLSHGKSRVLVQVLQMCQGVGILVEGMDDEALLQQVTGIAAGTATNVHSDAASGQA